MIELFKIVDCLDSPKGVIVAGANSSLDGMPHDELQRLLGSLRSVAIVGHERRLEGVAVQGFSVTTSVGGRRNVFLLLGQDISSESIPADGTVAYLET